MKVVPSSFPTEHAISDRVYLMVHRTEDQKLVQHRLDQYPPRKIGAWRFKHHGKCICRASRPGLISYALSFKN